LHLWWLEHGGIVGLGLGALGLLLFGLLLIPRGPVTLHTGRVTGFRALSSETGTEVYATVNVEGRPTVVQLPVNNGCSVGSAIALRKARFPLGARYAARGQACALADR
jgi:hypothetical protein